MTTFTWHIAHMRNAIADGGVFYVEWVCYGLHHTFEKSAAGTCMFTPQPSGNGFTPLSNLTEKQVLTWVWGQVDKAEVESKIEEMLQEDLAPTVDYTLPWLVAEPPEFEPGT